MRFFRIIAFLWGLWAMSASAESTSKQWTPSCALGIKEVTQVRVSPDHSHTVFVVKTADLKKGRWLHELYIASHNDNIVQRVVRKQTEISQPRWSCDSKSVWFLAEGKQHRALWQTKISSLSPQRRYETTVDITSFALAPDSRRVAYTTDLDTKQKYPGVKQYSQQTPKGLWVTTLDGGQSQRLLTTQEMIVGSHDGAQLSWSPDGRYIAFTYSKIDIRDQYAQEWLSHLAIADTKNNTVHDLVHGDSMNTNAHFSHDGKWVAYASNASSLARKEPHQYSFSQICLTSVDGKKKMFSRNL